MTQIDGSGPVNISDKAANATRPRGSYSEPLASSVGFSGGGVMAGSVDRHWRYKQAATQGLLFAVRWGIAVVLLGVVVRVTLTEIVTPPIFRLFMSELATTKQQGAAGGQAAGYLQLVIERGLLPNGDKLGTLPKATWVEMTPKTTAITLEADKEMTKK